MYDGCLVAIIPVNLDLTEGAPCHGRLLATALKYTGVKSLLYYITGHGFGHAVRSSLVIEQLLSVHAELMVHVRTSAPARLFPAAVTYSRQSLDVGVVQPDSLTMDIAETLRQCQRFYMSS